MPYRFLDVERETEACNLLTDADVTDAVLPAVVYPDGAVLANADPSHVAERPGFKTRADAEFYDLVIIGAGVYYGAAATGAPAIEGRDAYVVGGGNSTRPGRHVLLPLRSQRHGRDPW